MESIAKHLFPQKSVGLIHFTSMSTRYLRNISLNLNQTLKIEEEK